jgi:ABC-type branched-subunit amino acid transport system ATPase component
MKQNVPIALTLRGISKRFDRPAVDALDLTVYGGEFYVLVGPNGAGKTTTLRMVVGLLRPDTGSICQVTAWLSDEPDALRISRIRCGALAHRTFQGRSPRAGIDWVARSRTACT